MAIKEVENNLPRTPIKVQAYVPPIPFLQRLRKRSEEKKNIHAISTRIGIHLQRFIWIGQTKIINMASLMKREVEKI